MDLNQVEKSFQKLKSYIEDEKFKGWDPFDGLNSKFYKSLPLKNWKYFKWIWIQLFKRNPINLRKLFQVPKEYNSKGIGLFLHGYCQLYKIAEQGDNRFGSKIEIEERINSLYDVLIELQSKGYSGACWGYNFDWQNRVFFQPAYTPTVVATSFVANSLFEAYHALGDKKFLDLGLSSCEFVAHDLNRTMYKNGDFIFSYSPTDNSEVYNASLLGARLLAKGYSYTGNKDWFELAKKATKTICDLQCEDGSWVYGARNNQRWIDSFHTGFNLECIYEYGINTGDNSFMGSFEKGLDFYLSNFFLENGMPKYYHNRLYPIDVHSPAQFIVTLLKTGRLDDNAQIADKVLEFTINNLQSEKGHFYYQLNRFYKSKISFMRWSQSWMFYCLTMYLKFMLSNQEYQK